MSQQGTEESTTHGTPRVAAAASPDPAWHALGETIDACRLVVAGARKEELLEKWGRISEEERSLDDRLVLGLIGGTGVGKSTLINALAGEEISSSSDRRPTTDRIVVYRHRSTPLPPALSLEDIAQPEKTHTNVALERVILLDFPDFDSVVELHHEIFQRYAPQLDAILLVVDDVKYADARLYELLGALPQSHWNLHPILNKIDRLHDRYPGKSQPVIRGILEDLRAKLALHADIRVDADRVLALSARNAFRAKRDGDEPASDLGGFPLLLKFLAGYQGEKRRRAAKELNLEARKGAFVSLMRREDLGRQALKQAEGALDLARTRREETLRSFGRIPEALLGYDERRAVASNFLRRATQYVGTPVDTLWTLFGELRRRRGRAARRQARGAADVFSDSRAQRHYRGYVEAVENLRREVQLELGDVMRLGTARPATSLDPSRASFEEVRERFQDRLATCEERLRKRSSFPNHVLALLVLFGFLWTLLHPFAETTLKKLLQESEVSWGGVVKEGLLAVLDALDPSFWIGGLLSLALAYVATAVLTWIRYSQRIETAVGDTERELRDRVREQGESAMESVTGELGHWLEERERLDGAIRSIET